MNLKKKRNWQGYVQCAPPSSPDPPSSVWGWRGPGSVQPPHQSDCCLSQTPPGGVPLCDIDQTSERSRSTQIKHQEDHEWKR